MPECEHDKCIGRRELLELEGVRFKLSLEGQRWRGDRWVGSEYCTAKPPHDWYKGIGKILDAETKADVFITFSTWKGERETERPLINFVLISDRWEGGPIKELPIVTSSKNAFVDFLCQQVLAEMKMTETALLPHYCFRRLPDQILIERGFVFDRQGQISLPIVAAA